ncbi:competence protein ComK [Virgibacillus oceani]
MNKHTLALLPARHMNYATIACEQHKQYFIKKTPIQLVKAACLDHGATYQGRRGAAMYHTGFKRKVPIPISIKREIYTFPTHAPTDFECMWLFPNHIHSVINHPTSKKTPTKSIIPFKNGMQIPLDISSYMIHKQMERTSACRLTYSLPQEDIASMPSKIK